jgi:hypothetical protein
MRQNKTAVDATAKAYWTAYFPDSYGEELTGAIPRRVARHLVDKLRLSNPKHAQISPLGHAQTPTGNLLFEGIFTVVAVRRGREAKIARAFQAEISTDGRNLKVTDYPVPHPLK